ncbi:MAG: DM13 domain-containing protein [Microcoleaceae cyanobacterium]
MILNSLRLTSIASVLVLGTIGSLALNSTVVQANGVQAKPVITVAQSQQVLASGSFVTVEQDHATKGTARIVSEGGKRYLEFDKGFTTAQGPDVNVILHQSGSIPLKPKKADYVVVAALKSFDGAQRYALPDNIDLNEFKAVGIWCRKFDVTFGYAAL